MITIGMILQSRLKGTIMQSSLTITVFLGMVIELLLEQMNGLSEV